MVHYILDFSEASHYIYEDGAGRAIDLAEFDSVNLVLDSIEVKPAGKESVFYPAQDITIKLFEKDRQFGRILNRFPLPEGDYEFLKVHLKGGPGAKHEHPHTVKVADTVYQLDFIKAKDIWHYDEFLTPCTMPEPDYLLNKSDK